MSYQILLDLPATPHGNEREKRAMIVIRIPIVIIKAIAVERAARETMKVKAEVETTPVNDIRVTVDIVIPMRMRSVGIGDPIHQYPPKTVRIERIIYVKSDRSVRFKIMKLYCNNFLESFCFISSTLSACICDLVTSSVYMYIYLWVRYMRSTI